MKAWHMVLLIGALVAAVTPSASAQAAASNKNVPKYDVATEVTLKGPILEVSNRDCPVSGGMGFHLTIKQPDGQDIEVHVALTHFMKEMELALNKGDVVEVTGSKVKFEGTETVFAREIVIGNDTYTFREKTGKPVW